MNWEQVVIVKQSINLSMGTFSGLHLLESVFIPLFQKLGANEVPSSILYHGLQPQPKDFDSCCEVCN